MTFRVGQKVVCVKRDPWVVIGGPLEGSYPDPVYGEIVTVASINQYGQHTCLALEEYMPTKQDFAAIYFRPVQEQGMSILRSIAANPKQKIRELA